MAIATSESVEQVTSLTLDTIPTVLADITKDDTDAVAFNADTGVYEFVNYDLIMTKLDFWIEAASSREYDPDERKELKAISSMANKLSATITSSVTQSKKRLFDDVDTQKKQIVEKFKTLSTSLKAGIDAADKVTKADKRLRLVAAFDSAIKSFKHLPENELTFEDFEVSHWSNLSSSEASSIKELYASLQNADNVFGSKVNPSNDTKEIMHALRASDWDGLAAITTLIDKREEERLEIAAKLAEAAELKRLSEEREKSDNDIARVITPRVVERMTVVISSDDMQSVKNILDANSIDYEVIS
jgi:hypothetical protein